MTGRHQHTKHWVDLSDSAQPMAPSNSVTLEQSVTSSDMNDRKKNIRSEPPEALNIWPNKIYAQPFNVWFQAADIMIPTLFKHQTKSIQPKADTVCTSPPSSLELAIVV